MYGFILQDWITIRGANSPLITSITQTEQNWASLQPYQDIVFWLEVREITLSAATNIIVNFETAPMKDESLFLTMASQTVTVAQAAPFTPLPKAIAASAAVPLARWVRWKLALTGTPSAAWDMTFRITAAANAVSSLA